MAESFLHGIKLKETDGGTKVFASSDSSIVGLVGTSKVGTVAIGVPVIVRSDKEALALFGQVVKKDPAAPYDDTIGRALFSLFEQGASAVVVIRVPAPTPTGTGFDFTSVIGGVDPETSKYTGLKLLMNVDKEPVGKDKNGNDILLSSIPKILIATELSSDTSVAEALSRAAEAVRGYCFVDCPNEDKQAAIDFAASYTSSFSTPCYPAVDLGSNLGEIGLSAAAAGVMSRVTREDGYWVSPSNKIVSSVVRLSKPIGWSLSDAGSDANVLNQNGIMTVIRQDGFRLWGNLTRAGQADIRFKFISVRRIANELNDSAVRNHFWAIDQNITKSYVSTVTGGLNQKMRDMVSQGALLGGRAFVNAEENSASTIKLGNIKFSFEYTPVYPANEIEFESIMTDVYLKELIA